MYRDLNRNIGKTEKFVNCFERRILLGKRFCEIDLSLVDGCCN